MDKFYHKNFVSVIIPTFNRGWILNNAIESVLGQIYKHFELIVVDDGSTDNTWKILDQYKKQITIISQENKGVSAARNAGIKQAQGNLIAFLDSDDLWMPEKLLVQTNFFKANPDILICQTEEIWIRNGKRVNPKKKHKKPCGMIFKPCLSLCLISPSAVMLRRSIFEEIGVFDEKMPACEDYDLWLRLTYKYPVSVIDTPLIIKQGGHEDQLSKEPGLDKFRIYSLNKILKTNVLSKEQKSAAIKKLKEKCLIFAQGSQKRGKLEESMIYRNIVDYWHTNSVNSQQLRGTEHVCVRNCSLSS